MKREMVRCNSIVFSDTNFHDISTDVKKDELFIKFDSISTYIWNFNGKLEKFHYLNTHVREKREEGGKRKWRWKWHSNRMRIFLLFSSHINNGWKNTQELSLCEHCSFSSLLYSKEWKWVKKNLYNWRRQLQSHKYHYHGNNKITVFIVVINFNFLKRKVFIPVWFYSPNHFFTLHVMTSLWTVIQPNEDENT